MNPEKLSQLLRNPEAIENLSIDELNSLIDTYPYMQQLRDIKADKLKDFDKGGRIRHEAAIYNGGWTGDSDLEHEFVDLDALLSTIDQVEDDLVTADGISLELENAELAVEPAAISEEATPSVILLEEEEGSVTFEETIEDSFDSIDSEVIVATGLGGVASIVLDEDVDENALEEEIVEEDPVLIESSLDADEIITGDEVSETVDHVIVDSIFDAKSDEVTEEVIVDEKLIDEIGKIEDVESETEVFKHVEYEEIEVLELTSIDELVENELVQIKKKKKRKKQKLKKDSEIDKEKSKKSKKKDKKKKEKIKEEKKGKKKKKKEDKKSTKKNKKSKKEKHSKDKKNEERRDDKGIEKLKSKKPKNKKTKEKLIKPKTNYAAWLLEQKQISKKGKKRKKKKKVVAKAMESVKKKAGIISEPLAELLAIQGHFNQAKAMYIELSLIFPEKSAYFAAQIENLENK